MYMYVNKRVELAQRGISLQKVDVLLILLFKNLKENEAQNARVWGCSFGGVYVPCVLHVPVQFMYLVFTRTCAVYVPCVYTYYWI